MIKAFLQPSDLLISRFTDPPGEWLTSDWGQRWVGLESTRQAMEAEVLNPHFELGEQGEENPCV